MQLEVMHERQGLLCCLGHEEDLDHNVKLAPARLGHLERRLLDGCDRRLLEHQLIGNGTAGLRYDALRRGFAYVSCSLNVTFLTNELGKRSRQYVLHSLLARSR